jgi:hypothetical protein
MKKRIEQERGNGILGTDQIAIKKIRKANLSSGVKLSSADFPRPAPCNVRFYVDNSLFSRQIIK